MVFDLPKLGLELTDPANPRASFPHATSALSDGTGGSKTSPYFGRATSPPKMHASFDFEICRLAPKETAGCGR
jgi:hypothetical protein